jgi:hypothetical protein
MKKYFLLSLLSVFLLWSYASATLITFDNLPAYHNSSSYGDPGDYGTRLSYGHVTFKTVSGSHLLVTSTDWDRGFGIEHSLPNKLSCDAPVGQRTVSEITMLFDSPVKNVSFWLSGLFRDTGIYAYDKKGKLLESFVQTYPQTGPLAPDGRPWDYYYAETENLESLNISGISKVKVLTLYGYYDYFSIDNLSFNERVVGLSPSQPPCSFLDLF